jgi:hypothetical protein
VASDYPSGIEKITFSSISGPLQDKIIPLYPLFSPLPMWQSKHCLFYPLPGTAYYLLDSFNICKLAFSKKSLMIPIVLQKATNSAKSDFF